MKFIPFGAIDIGSNAIRLLIKNVVEYPEQTKYKKVSLIRIPLRLGEDVFNKNKIDKNKANRLIEGITGFSHILKAYNVVNYRAVATSAMREANNGLEIIEKIKDKTGINIEIISGLLEAEIIYQTGVSQIVSHGKYYLYIDVGGGSTEVSVLDGKDKVASESFKIGTVRSLSGTVNSFEIERYRNFLVEQAKKYPNIVIIGSGGNINKVFKLMNKKYGESISLAELENMYSYLTKFTYEQRINILRLNPDRADVIVPAVNIFLQAYRFSNAIELFVPKIGISDGLIKLIYQDYKVRYAINKL